jgi:hypothetical protein
MGRDHRNSGPVSDRVHNGEQVGVDNGSRINDNYLVAIGDEVGIGARSGEDPWVRCEHPLNGHSDPSSGVSPI